MRKCKDDRGPIMLESTFCILLSIIVLMFMLSFGFFLYQQAVVNIITNEVTEEMIQTHELHDISDNPKISSKDI